MPDARPSPIRAGGGFETEPGLRAVFMTAPPRDLLSAHALRWAGQQAWAQRVTALPCRRRRGGEVRYRIAPASSPSAGAVTLMARRNERWRTRSGLSRPSLR